jgi:transposase
MPIIPNTDRNQLQMMSLEEMVDEESMARLIDAYCMSYDAESLGFVVKGKSHEGRPAFSGDTLVRIYLYGYLHKLRSSRDLDRACRTNVELWWLTGSQMPCYKTIADFRKDNKTGFRNLFKHFREFCRMLKLFGEDTVAIDGAKFRAQNSKKNNYNKRKVKQHQDYIHEQTEQYLEELDKADEDGSDMEVKDIKKKLDKLKERKAKYNSLDEQLNKNDELQISTTDPDARAIPLQFNIVQMAYNIQAITDDKYSLVADYQVTNQNDMNALSSAAIQGKAAFELEEDDMLTVLADKGYYNGEEIEICHQNNIDTLVSPRDRSNSKKDKRFKKNKFKYIQEKDVYVCPEGHEMKSNGKYYQQTTGRKNVYRFKRYTLKFSTCSLCPYANECAGGKLKQSQGKSIERSEFADATEHNNEQVALRKNEYRRRQSIVEHPFGTIKRGWGFTYTLLKTIPKVETEFSLIFLCYNFRRLVTILGFEGLKKALQALFLAILGSWRLMSAHKKIDLFIPVMCQTSSRGRV